MNSRFPIRPRTLAATISALVAVSGFTAHRLYAIALPATDDASTGHQSALVGLSAVDAPARYIVRFEEAPLAEYNSVVGSKPVNGISSIPLKIMKNGRARLDVMSPQAKSYVQYVQQQQQLHLADIATALKQPVTPRYAMQHALNAVLLELTPEQAQAVASVPGVVAVERDRPHALATDIGPGFIGAASVWWGTPAGQDTLFASGFDTTGGYLGDGMVIGDIDTGYNSLSPSFAVTDAKGYTIQNPLGSGNFIGQCNLGGGPTGISLAGCNDKVIGAYDEIDLTGSCTGPCPTQFSVEDTQGHGSHTASTAAGDFRSATLSGYTANIAGVAPHANLVIYYACSPDTNVQCSTAATSASVDQAIKDGIVDALNYSISGGTTPWNDSTSLAFLSAADAGIFVAAAAGNTSASVPTQAPGTANHWEPWVTTVAAGTHTGGAIAPDLSITGPGTPPSNVQNQPLTEGSGDTPPTGTIAANIVLSPAFHINNTSGSDGCSAYTAGQFSGAIALVSRGTCSFSTKVTNAVNAGAIAVVISDNRPEAPFTPSVAGATVPVYSITQAQGFNFQAFLSANSNTGTAVIPYPPIRQPQQPDVLANFSLLGPTTVNLVKPDVQAPGVNILAAIANDGSGNGPNLVALYNGTSMATPHTTGSGALMLGLHPDWTPLEAKSALMMTAKEAGLTKANGTTPSDYFDRGSGRLQDFVASHAGLVMNETGLSFTNANPGSGGDPTTLNLASLQNAKCINSCNFTRKFRSTQDHAVTWTASVAAGPNPGFSAVTVSPSSFSIAAHATRPVTFAVNSSGLPSDGSFHFAEVTLTPSDASLTPLHLTMAIAVPPPTIAAAPNPLSITGVGAGSASGTENVSNVGGPTLSVTQATTGSVPYVWSNQISGNSYGYTSTQYTGRVGSDSDFFAADDFTITGNTPVNLTKIFAPGFVANNTLSSFGPSLAVHWRIYSDASGKPSSDPDTGGATVWSFDSTAGGAGVSVTGPFGGDISLDLVAAGTNTMLPAGHYWLVVYPTLPCNDGGSGCTEAWYWLTSTNGSGSSAVTIGPQLPSPAWNAIDPATGAGLAMHLESSASCVPPSWLSATGFPLALGGASSAPVTVTATAPLGGTSATGYLCLSSNDAVTPILPVQVNASQ